MRLLQALKINFPHLSQKQIRTLIKDKQVMWHGRLAKISDDIQDPKELIIPPTATQTNLQPNPNLKLKVLFEDRHFIFVEKPSSLHSVALSYSDTESVANGLLNLYPELYLIDPLECGLAHRLDFETSGVMVAAKNQDSYEHLRQIFQNSQIEKIYTALCINAPPRIGVYRACVLDGAKSAKRIFLSHEHLSARWIETEVLDVKALKTDYRLTLKLITGHRHQIRAHLAFLDCPLKGDTLYGDTNEPPFQLHAQSLAFQFNQKNYFVESVL